MGQIYFEFGNSWNQWQVTIGSKLQLDRAIHLCELTLSYARYYLYTSVATAEAGPALSWRFLTQGQRRGQ